MDDEDFFEGYAVLALDTRTEELFVCVGYFDTLEEAERTYGDAKRIHPEVRYLPIPMSKGWKYKPVWENK